LDFYRAFNTTPHHTPPMAHFVPLRKESVTLAQLNKELEEDLFESKDGSNGCCCVPLLDHRRQLVRFLGFTASAQYHGHALSDSFAPRVTRLMPWAMCCLFGWIGVIVLFVMKLPYGPIVLPLQALNMFCGLVALFWSWTVTRAAKDFDHLEYVAPPNP
jgi:hypothetical protein